MAKSWESKVPNFDRLGTLFVFFFYIDDGKRSRVTFRLFPFSLSIGGFGGMGPDRNQKSQMLIVGGHFSATFLY